MSVVGWVSAAVPGVQAVAVSIDSHDPQVQEILEAFQVQLPPLPYITISARAGVAAEQGASALLGEDIHFMAEGVDILVYAVLGE